MVLQEKTLLGWKDIPIKDHYDYDNDFYMGSLVYLKAEVGKTYRVYCTHYAIINGEEYTLYNITDSIVYNLNSYEIARGLYTRLDWCVASFINS